MRTDSIIVIFKRSRFERDMNRHSCSEDDLIAFYRNLGVDWERIRQSGRRQERARAELASFLAGAKFVPAEAATRMIAKNASLVVALGGDNHFQRVARLLDQEPLAGINSDPATSTGKLTRFNTRTFKQAFSGFAGASFPIDHWARLQVTVDEKPLSNLALCEVFIGERDRCVMSRHVLHFRRRREEQKGSGLLVVTGSGSTGWYQSAANGLASDVKPYAQSSPSFKFLLTEPHRAPGRKHLLIHGVLARGDRLKVVSLNRRHGVVSLDAFQQQPIRYGAKVEVVPGRPLSVLTVASANLAENKRTKK